jgi:DNA replication and repair protein RecF
MIVAGHALVCRQLRLRDFRNFSELEIEFPAGGVAVVGANGSGKTNLLEAIYYLEILKSLRGAPDDQLVRFGADAFHVRGRFEDLTSGEVHEITAAYDARTRTKRVTIDGAPPVRLGDAIGRVRVVVFTPADMSIVAGSPAERRRFLDIVLSVNVAGHVAALQRYRHVLRQRNASLKSGGRTRELEAWDAGLVEAGARVVHDRARWVAEYRDEFERHACRVGGGTGARIAYLAGVPLDGVATIAQVKDAFAAELQRVAGRERERGMTLAGPHRDDLSLLALAPEREVDLRSYGSAGQLRTAAIALRMVEAESARRARGSRPMILLDDVFAELDAGRSRRTLAMLDEECHGQMILTAPKESDLPGGEGGSFVASLPRWRIEAGRIST